MQYASAAGWTDSGTPLFWCYKDKDEMIKEIRPLPQGLGGEIKVEHLSYREDGDTAMALFRQYEIERY